MKSKIEKFITIFILLLWVECCYAGQPAYVAGSFYPSDAKELKQTVRSFIDGEKSTTEEILALVSPHAGYIFSGKTAGAAYREIAGKDYSVVILLGLAHQYPVRGAAVDAEGFFETPLGKVPVDSEGVSRLLALSPLIQIDKKAFRSEHSLEVQIPFLQESLSEFSIVPLLMNENSEVVTREIGNAIAQLVKENESKGKKTLMISSTDLSHYPNEKDAQESDAAILKHIEVVDADGLRSEARAQILKEKKNLVTALCGEANVLTMLYAARELGAKQGKVLMHTTSADSAEGEPGRVVGYGAAAIFKNSVMAGDPKGRQESRAKQSGKDVIPAPFGQAPVGRSVGRHRAVGAAKAGIQLDPRLRGGDIGDQNILSKDEQEYLLKAARDSLESFVRTGQAPAFQPSSNSNLRKARAVFVTLTKSGELRGCMGETEAKLPLEEAVRKFSIVAGTEDPRFGRVTAPELDLLSYEISVLTPLKPASSADEIRPGLDGVAISKGAHFGIFLPQVWKSTGWDKQMFLSELASQKAGLSPDAWKDPRAQLFTFTVFEFSDEYVAVPAS